MLKKKVRGLTMYQYGKDPKQDSLLSAEQNREMFEHIAGYYDGTNRLLSLGLDSSWRRRAVEFLQPEPDGKYLDVGCGTGDLTLEILRQEPGAHVIGIDPSEGMLAIGKEKVSRAGMERNVSLRTGDVLNLDFRHGEFDGAIAAFCIRNVTQRLRGLTEIRRVLKPGGVLVILELTEPTGPIMRPLFRIYARVVMPVATKVLSSAPAYRYLADSMADFPHPELFLELMTRAGFDDLNYKHLSAGIATIFVGWA